MNAAVTVPGQFRRRLLPHLDFERVLILIGIVGVLAAVVVALWSRA